MPNVNFRAPGQSANQPQSAPTPAGGAQSPSVPISLYREVASELQTTQTTLQSLKTQNQELTQKNQQLRLEIERVVQSALHLRQIADPSWGSARAESGALSMPAEFAGQSETAIAPDAIAPEPLFTEQAAPPATPTPTETTTEISTWWLIVIICTIVITAFGTGFLIVRPLLPSR